VRRKVGDVAPKHRRPKTQRLAQDHRGQADVATGPRAAGRRDPRDRRRND
jgi:hypothetical protein